MVTLNITKDGASMNKPYIKHLVECKCILKIFEGKTPPVFHKFVVFSEFYDNSGDMIPSFAQCNNCGVIHNVTEVSTSSILRKEEMRTIISTEELEMELPQKVVSLLKSNDCDLHVWQEAKHILQHQLWGKFIVLSREKEGTVVHGKALVILGEGLFKIESFEQPEEYELSR